MTTVDSYFKKNYYVKRRKNVTHYQGYCDNEWTRFIVHTNLSGAWITVDGCYLKRRLPECA
jgi:hypothetical protein